MKNITLIVGSVSGASEDVAETLAEHLQQLGHQTHIELDADLSQLDPNDIWLVCCSTHGAGDYPDNIQPFAEQLKQQPTLSQLSYGLVALGDSSYDTFCHAGINIDQLLQQAGAKAFSPLLTIDVSQHMEPEQTALQWLQQQKVC